MNEEITWPSIASTDPFLAGSIAARGWLPWMDETPESIAESMGLQGEHREKFLQGWRHELAEQEKSRKEQAFQERDEIGQVAFSKGDPANW